MAASDSTCPTCASDHVGDIESVSEFEGGDYGGTYECKGHVLKNDFVKALKEQWNVEADTENVRHVYMRYVPYRDGVNCRSMGKSNWTAITGLLSDKALEGTPVPFAKLFLWPVWRENKHVFVP